MCVTPKQINKKVQNVLDMPKETEWPTGAKVKLGAALIKLLIETACWTHDKDRGVVTPWDKGTDRVGGRGDATEVPVPQAAFLHNVVSVKKSRQGSLSLAPEIFSKVMGCMCCCVFWAATLQVLRHRIKGCDKISHKQCFIMGVL